MRDNKIVFALDIGFGNVKAYGPAMSTNGTGRAEPPREMQFHFPSVVVRAHSLTSEGTGALARFNVHRVAVGDEEYFVGEDAPRLTNQRQIVDMSRDYPTTPQYYALALGAMERAGYRHIDVLVLGLPAQYSNDEDLVAAMRTRFIGEHVTAAIRVQVDDVMVFSQPVGGVASFAYEREHMETMRHNRCLVIDPGYNTLDWAEVNHYKIVRRECDSVHGGMGLYLMEVFARVRKRYPDLQAGTYTDLDAAARGEGVVKYAGKAIDVSPHAEAALGVFDAPIGSMVAVTGPLTAFGAIFLIGGAAKVFEKALRRRYPDLTLTLPDSPPMMANARGFYVMGMRKLSSGAETNGRAGSLPPRVQTVERSGAAPSGAQVGARSGVAATREATHG